MENKIAKPGNMAKRSFALQMQRMFDQFAFFMQNKPNERQAKPGKEDAFAYMMS